MNTENNKTGGPRRFKLDLTDKLSLKNPNRNIASANLSIYYIWKNIKSKYRNNKFKISAPNLNDTFDLPDGSFSITLNYHQKTWKFNCESTGSNLPK